MLIITDFVNPLEIVEGITKVILSPVKVLGMVAASRVTEIEPNLNPDSCIFSND